MLAPLMEAAGTRLRAGGGRQPPFVRIDDVERTLFGADVDVACPQIQTVREAIEILMAIGPAGEILRLRGNRASRMHEPVKPALRDGRAEMLTARRRWGRSAHLERERRRAHCLT